MRRRLGAALLAAAAVATLSACGSSSSKTAAPTNGGDLVIGRAADIQSLDPTKLNDNMSIWTVDQIYDTLYKTSPDGKTLEPSLATGYKVSPDNLTWTFTLRSDVTFSDGTPLTATDVKYSYERNASDKTNPFASFDEVVSSITTPDPHTVVFKTKQPWAPFLSDTALYANSILPNNLEGKSESDFFANPVGSGPFKLAYWKKGEAIKLVKNTRYWVKDEPKLNSVTFAVVPDDNTRKLQLQGGQIDVDQSPPFSQLAQLKSAKGVTVKLFPYSRTDYILFNFHQKPFQDVNVRRAISYAIDRQAMVKAVLDGNGQVANSILSNTFWAYDKTTPGIQFDLTKAKAELAASSVPNGFSTTLLVGAGDSFQNTLGEIVQQELAPLNIKVTIKPADTTTQQTLLADGKYDMGFANSTTDISDPDELVTVEAVGGPQNPGTRAFFTNYYNPEVQKLSNQAEVVLDQSKRQELYSKLQYQVAEDAPMVFLFYTPNAYAYSDKVNNFTVSPSGMIPLAQVSLS